MEGSRSPGCILSTERKWDPVGGEGKRQVSYSVNRFSELAQEAMRDHRSLPSVLLGQREKWKDGECVVGEGFRLLGQCPRGGCQEAIAAENLQGERMWPVLSAVRRGRELAHAESEFGGGKRVGSCPDHFPSELKSYAGFENRPQIAMRGCVCLAGNGQLKEKWDAQV